MKKPAALLMGLMLILLAGGCKSPDQIEADVKENKTTQEIVFKQEVEKEVRTLSVTGIGRIDATPDVATVELSVTVQEETAEAAQARNSEQMQAVLEAIKSFDVKDEDIKTREVSIYPVQESEKTPSEITGYTAANTINIRVRKVNQTGEIVAAAMQAGANKLLQVEFHLLDETDAYREALAAAVADAHQKAQVMAPELRVDLDGPSYVVESTNLSMETNNLVRYEAELTNEQVEGSGVLETPLQAGVITVEAQVTVEYLMKYPAAPPPMLE